MNTLIENIVDYLKIDGSGGNYELLLDKFHRKFNLGTINKSTGTFRFFGVTMIQNDNLSIELDANDKLNNIMEQKFSRHRQKEPDEAMNDLENYGFE